jgi:hypothetical protein
MPAYAFYLPSSSSLLGIVGGRYISSSSEPECIPHPLYHSSEFALILCFWSGLRSTFTLCLAMEVTIPTTTPLLELVVTLT